jgi:hypothetical protein
MKMDNALAAGQGGNDPTPASTQDEIHRQSAVEQLAGYLARGGALLARCEALANAARGDRLGPVYAAARLLNANAQVAKALAHVALVESRRRTIIETVQIPAPKKAELNSPFLSAEEEDNALEELERRLDALAAAAKHEQERQQGLAAGSSI